MTNVLPVHRPTFRHLTHLTDDRGILEHARGTAPRFSHGYCTDDNARLLIVALRDRDRTPGAGTLVRVAARFVLDALADDGRFHNRLSFERIWTDTPSTCDCWGRGVWALGEAFATLPESPLGEKSREAFDIAVQQRSPFLRSMAYATLGASSVVSIEPLHSGARRFLLDARQMFAALGRGGAAWNWPEERLAYANAVIPEALLACGEALSDERLIDKGLAMLRWLADTETCEDRLSPTPVGGRGACDPQPAFDQQPIEVSSLAQAAARAARLSSDPYWDEVVDRAVTWFLGNNDLGEVMIDLDSGGGYDALTTTGVNINQGAESTLAMISTLQFRSSMWLV